MARLKRKWVAVFGISLALAPLPLYAQNNIISLTSTGSGAPTSYGSLIDSLTVNGNTTAGYTVSSAPVSPAGLTGYAKITYNVTPTYGDEKYALKLSSASADATIVADINAESATDAVTAALFAGSAYSTYLPNYDILLYSNAANALDSSAYLGFDLSQDSNVTGITVVNVGALSPGITIVPEPASLSLLAVGSVTLLLRRRPSDAIGG